MARRLIDAGFPLTVWNRTRERAVALAEHGASVAEHPDGLASCDLVIAMLYDAPALNAVLWGERGLLTSSLTPGNIVSMATIGLIDSETLRQRVTAAGVDYLAAPVSGSVGAASSGDLVIFASGSRVAYDAAKPCFDVLGRHQEYLGDASQALVAKLAIQLYLGTSLGALAEVAAVVRREGMSLEKLLDVLGVSVMSSRFLQYKREAFLGNDRSTAFSVASLRKDIRFGLEAAYRDRVPAPISAQVDAQLSAAVDAGAGGLDFGAMVRIAAGLE
jgi:3-hydroxyisobutyrate dehydrogenase-like beta-hydroxyacid dehydrogenase